MPQRRRELLKTAGAIGAGSVLAVGTAAGNEECTETIKTVERTEATNELTGVTAPVWFGNSTGGLPVATEPFTIESGAFEAAALPENRIKGVMTWNPTAEDPTTAELYLERQTIAGDWQIIGKDGYEPVFVSAEPVTENRLELTAVNGDTFKGDDTTGTEVENPVIVDGGQTYRFVVRVYDGVIDFSVTGQVQAFDAECLEKSE